VPKLHRKVERGPARAKLKQTSVGGKRGGVVRGPDGTPPRGLKRTLRVYVLGGRERRKQERELERPFGGARLLMPLPSTNKRVNRKIRRGLRSRDGRLSRPPKAGPTGDRKARRKAEQTTAGSRVYQGDPYKGPRRDRGGERRRWALSETENEQLAAIGRQGHGLSGFRNIPSARRWVLLVMELVVCRRLRKTRDPIEGLSRSKVAQGGPGGFYAAMPPSVRLFRRPSRSNGRGPRKKGRVVTGDPARGAKKAKNRRENRPQKKNTVVQTSATEGGQPRFPKQ